jgi:hypothetical protein
MGKIELIENVLVFNGVDEHILDYSKPNFRIKNLVNWVSRELPNELVKHINKNKLQVYMETDLEYNTIKFLNLKSDEKDMILNFRNLTKKFCE